jgi:predicted dehydrogenase
MLDSSPPAREIRFGVIGLGFMGATHVAALSGIRGASLAAVVDRDPNRLTGAANGGGNLETGAGEMVFDSSEVAVFDTVDAMLAGCELELAVVTTPTPTHVDIAASLISAGLHVLIEKPVALDVGSIRRLEALAADSGVIAMPAHCMRFWPAWNWIHERIRDTTYGSVRRASFVRTGAAPSWNPDFYRDPSKTGGAIVDLHIHDTDFVIHSFGMPGAVSSTGSRSHVRTEYLFENGPVVEAVGGWLEDPEAPFTMTAEIEFEEGTISFSLGREPEILVTRSGGVTTKHPEASVGGTGYDVQAAALIEAIRSGSGTPPVSLGDAARTGGVLDLEIESLESGGEVRSVRG